MACDETRRKSLTPADCPELPGLLLSMITTGPNFKATKAQWEDPEFWQAAIKADPPNRIYPWPNFAANENVSTEATYEDSVYGILPASDGQYRWRQGYRQSMCWHRAAFTHRSNSGRVILMDETSMIGMRNSAGEFMGLTKQLLHTEKMIFSDGAVATKSPILVALANPKEFDQSGYMIPSSVLDGLTKVVDVVLTIIGTPADDEIIVDVMTECDNYPVLGLALADFILKDADGNTQSISSRTADPVVQGRYTLSGTGFTSGTLELKPASTLSLSAYDHDAVTVTIPS